MASKADIILALQDELEACMDTHSDVNTPAQHVGKKGGDDVRYPYFGFEAFTRPTDTGIGGRAYLDHIEYDENGFASTLVFAVDEILTIDITVSVDDDNAAKRDSLNTALHDHLDQYVSGGTNPTLSHKDIHEDIEEFVVNSGGSEANRQTDGVRGVDQSFEIRYSRHSRFTDFDPMRDINLVVKDLDSSEIFTSEAVN